MLQGTAYSKTSSRSYSQGIAVEPNSVLFQDKFVNIELNSNNDSNNNTNTITQEIGIGMPVDGQYYTR
jgi:hypothetical protein